MPLYNENVRVYWGEIGDEDEAVLKVGPAEQAPDTLADLHVGPSDVPSSEEVHFVADQPPPEDEHHVGATPSKVRKLSGEAVESMCENILLGNLVVIYIYNK